MNHKTLFSGLQLAIEDGEKLGIIGPNGAGKSTLLKILAGFETADQGQVATKKGLKLATIEQEPKFPDNTWPLSYLTQKAKEYGFEEQQAEQKAQKILSRFGFSDDDRSIAQLSGGWKKRLAIAEALLAEPDLVLLDEPTNHLDLRSVLWLEDLLKKANFAWIMVSHDRFFLDRTAQRILEIHPMFPGRHHIERGTYSEFVEKKAAFIHQLQEREASLANKLRREEEWLVRQPKARGTKSRARIDEAMRMKGERQDLQQRLSGSSAQIEFQGSARKSKQLIAWESLGQSYGDRRLFEKAAGILSPKMTIGILGDNGTGKSTLLKLFAGIEKPSEGTLKFLPDLEVVYFDQAKESLPNDITLKRALAEAGQDTVIFRDRPIHVASWARRFQFRVEQLEHPLKLLSGGERARVLIARLMLRKADVLLLDEPNNDLDIDTLEVLEESLDDFPGAIVLVSHDRYLLDRLCTHFLAITKEGLITAFADYEQWEKSLLQADKPKKEKGSSGESSASGVNSAAKATKKGKFSYQEQRDWDAMEANILAAETELAQWESRLAEMAQSEDHEGLLKATQSMELAQSRVDALYMRWSELEAKRSGESEA